VFVGAASVSGRASNIMCKYISKYQWELSVAAVALHYARQPLESAVSVCWRLGCGQTHNMDELANGIGTRIGLLSRMGDVRVAYYLKLAPFFIDKRCIAPYT
jgi:hypothetical protein